MDERVIPQSPDLNAISANYLQSKNLTHSKSEPPVGSALGVEAIDDAVMAPHADSNSSSSSDYRYNLCSISATGKPLLLTSILID